MIIIRLIQGETMIKQLEYAESILRSNPTKAYEISKEVVDVTEPLTQDYIDALSVETKALWLLSQFEEAITRSDYMKEIATKLGDNLGIAKANNVIGNVYYDLSNYDKSLEYYMKALSFAKNSNDKRIEAYIHNNLGEIYNAIDAYDEALKYYMLSLEISQTLDEELIVGITQLNLAELHVKQGKVDEGLSFTHTALDMFVESEDYISISYAHYLLAKIHRQTGRTEKAHRELILAIEIMRRMQDQISLVQAYTTMVELLIEEKNYDEALEYVEDGLDVANRIGVKKSISQFALFAADLYERIEHYSKSLEYYKIYTDNRLKYEKEKEEEHQKNITAQINIEKAMHDKEIYRLRNVELRKKSEEIHKLYEDMKIINTIGQDITSTLDIEKILYMLYENVNKLMDATTFGIFLYDAANNSLSTELFLIYGQLADGKNISLEDHDSMGAWCMRNKQAVLSNNFIEESKKYVSDYHDHMSQLHLTQSLILVPLMMQGELVGAITVQSTNQDAYKDYHFNMIKALAAYIAIAIKNSQESEKLSNEITERIKTQNELELLNERLSHMSYVDALTEIPNRRSFVDYIQREISRSKRLKEQMAVLIVDIDYFKEYNDNYGHVEGDYCLKQVASLLKKALKRDIDFVARYGGDEFIAVMSAIDYDGANQVAEMMRIHIREADLEHKNSPIEDIITITIGGYVLIPDSEDTMELIIHRADKALYDAKDKGRNQISFYNDII